MWFDVEEADNVRKALASQKMSTPDWAAAAYARLLRETDQELESLLHGRKYNSKVGKEMVSMRVRQDTIEDATKLAEKYDASIQTVLSTAFAMHALAPDLTTASELIADGQVQNPE
jgi:hypothetical protein